MEKRFKFVETGSFLGGELYAVNGPCSVFLGNVATYQIAPFEERAVGITGGGHIVMETLKPAMVKFVLDTAITIECPIETVEP